MFTYDQGGLRRDEVVVRAPPPDLAAWVEHLVVDPRPRVGPGGWRIVPDMCAHLLAHGRTVEGAGGPGEASGAAPVWGGLRSAATVGARTVAVDGPRRRRGVTVGVRLRPGALAGLTRTPAREFTDRGVSLDAAFGRAGRDALGRLAASDSADEALDALTALVRQATRGAEAPDWRARVLARAVRGAVGASSVRERRRRAAADPAGLAAATGLAPRTLRAASADHVGLSPRTWLRVARLFRALESALEETPGAPWSRVAHRTGYHDPPHLTREFRALLGETPTRFLRRRAGGTGRTTARPCRPVQGGGGASDV